MSASSGNGGEAAGLGDAWGFGDAGGAGAVAGAVAVGGAGDAGRTARTVASTAEMEALGRELGARLRAGDLVVLTGPLGAGKTTLTRGIGDALGVRGPITSPTFVLARTHPSLVGGPELVHVDAYRLGGVAELDDLDIDFEASVVVAEWGRGLIEGESDSWLEVVIERPEGAGADFDPADAPEEPRLVTFAGHGPRWEGRS